MNEKKSSGAFAHIMYFHELESHVTAAAAAHGIVGNPMAGKQQLGTLREELTALDICLDVPKSVRKGCVEIGHEMARATVLTRERNTR